MTASGAEHSHHVRRTQTTLADGRPLIYFDDSEPYVGGGATRRLDDPRPLPPRFAATPDQGQPPGPEMRLDPLTGDWIPMASHRMDRTFLPAADSCPLCPARPDAEYSDGEVPDTGYDVVVFENRFPALMQLPGVTLADGWDVDGEPLWAARPAAGRCEVVCFSSDHDSSFADLTPARVRTIVEAWADRTAELGALDGIEQVFCFENRGREIGVTLPHPHGQIYAFPYVAPRTQAMLRQAAEYRDRTGGHLLRDVVDAERRAGTRVVLDTEHWTAYVPAAARWPVEVHLAPKRDVLDLPGLTDAERDDLAVTYLELLRRLDSFFVETDGTRIPLPYIAGWHQAVVGEGRELGRLHLQVFSVLRAPGKLKYLAGVESGVASWISDTTPERIAARLQAVAPVSCIVQPSAATDATVEWIGSWSQSEGTSRAAAAFRERFATEPDGIWSAPGRVNIIGEHTDYNGGLCLPIALPHRAYVALRRRDDDQVRLASAQEPGAGVVSLHLSDVAPGTVQGWAAYVAGVAWALQQDGHGVSGFDAVVDSCVPYGAGLSSSAALECAVAVALDDVHHLGLGADDAGRGRLAAACIRAENEIAGAPTGGMDQSASLLCQVDHALLLDCRDGSVRHIPFELAAHGLALLVVDTRAEHQHVDGQYGARRRTCEDAARVLGVTTLREVTDLDSALDVLAGLPDAAAAEVARRRVRHVVTEIARVRQVEALLDAGAVEQVGAVLTAAHTSLRDDYEVSCPELDLAVEAALAAGALGGRMVGGGFGGCIIALVRTEEAAGVAAAVTRAFLARGWAAPAALVAEAAAPAGRDA